MTVAISNPTSPRLVFNAGGSFVASSPLASLDNGGMHAANRSSPVDIDQGLNKISSLLQGPSRIPTQAAAELASSWLSLIVERAAKLGGWRRPHISSTEAGEVVFEWWNKDRNLTLYFSDEGAEYIEVWGPDMDNDMVSSTLTNWSFAARWLRLHS